MSLWKADRCYTVFKLRFFWTRFKLCYEAANSFIIIGIGLYIYLTYFFIGVLKLLDIVVIIVLYSTI